MVLADLAPGSRLNPDMVKLARVVQKTAGNNLGKLLKTQARKIILGPAAAVTDESKAKGDRVIPTSSRPVRPPVRRWAAGQTKEKVAHLNIFYGNSEENHLLPTIENIEKLQGGRDVPSSSKDKSLSEVVLSISFIYNEDICLEMGTYIFISTSLF